MELQNNQDGSENCNTENNENRSPTIGDYIRQNWDKYIFTFVIFVEYFISVLNIFFVWIFLKIYLLLGSFGKYIWCKHGRFYVFVPYIHNKCFLYLHILCRRIFIRITELVKLPCYIITEVTLFLLNLPLM